MFFQRKPGEVTDGEIAEIQRWERDVLKRYFATQKAADDLWPSVERLVLARSPREIVAALQAHPVLLTERGDLALSSTEFVATVMRLRFAAGVLADRRAWIERLHDVDAAARRLSLLDDL